MTAALAAMRAAALALLLLCVPQAASAQAFPAFTGLVTDAAGVLPADRKAALEAKLEAFQQRTQRQLVVATVPDLQGYSIEDYGYRLGRSWGVGLKGADNGAILLVAPKERQVRIEVGYRLEPVLTDALSSVIVQQKIVPAFKAGDLPGGIEAGADAIAEQLSLPDAEAKARTDAAVREFDRTHRRARGAAGAGVPLGVIFWLLVVGFIFLAHRRRAAGPWGGRRYRGGGGGSNWPIWLWAASEIARGSGGRSRDDGGGFFGGGGGGDGGSDGGWGGGGFTGGGGGSFGGGGSSGSW